MLFYILKFGKDFRTHGLECIIRLLWNSGTIPVPIFLGESVKPSDLPDFLDERAKKFILFKSQKLNDISDTQNMLSM